MSHTRRVLPSSGHRARWAFRAAVLACFLGALPVLAESAPAAAAQPAGTSAASGNYDWVPILEPSATAFPETPEDRWLRDENGNEYTLFRWRKHDGYYHFEENRPGFVKLNHMMRLPFDHQDDEYLYIRWYRTAPIVEVLEADARRAAAEAEAIRASYRTEIASSDRLRLEPWDQGLPREQQWRNGFALADMNGDGHLDIVHGPPRKGSVATPVIFLGDGAGSWRYWGEAKFPALPYDYGDIDVGDLDGDGHMDIVLASHLTGLFALRGDGAGTFANWGDGLPLRRSAIQRQREIERDLLERSRPSAPKQASPKRERRSKSTPQADPRVPGEAPPPEFTSRAIALADWNADGRLDILALSEGPTAVQDITDEAATPLGKIIFLNQGNGSWREQHGPGQQLGDVILPVDLDRDGRLDFVTDSRGIGSGQVVNYGAADGSWTAGELPEVRGKVIVHGIAVDDFDRDGSLDLALTFQSSDAGEVRKGLDLYFGQSGEVRWRRSSVYATTAKETGGMNTLVSGDIDTDGDADLVALTEEGRVWIFLNDGKGSFVREQSPEAEPGEEHLYCAGYAATIRDIDRDGRNELVAAFAGEPGSEAMFVGTLTKRCEARGALRAWRVGPAIPGEAEAPAP